MDRLSSISIDDNYIFKKREDVMEACFYPCKIGLMKATAETYDGCYAWFPKAQVKDKNGKIKSGASSSNWKNYITNDGKKFVGWLYQGEMATDSGTAPTLKKRISPLHCFWCDDIKNISYRYVGTFVLDRNISEERHLIYRRVKDNIDLTQWCFHNGDFSYIDFDREGLDAFSEIYLGRDYKYQKSIVNKYLSVKSDYNHEIQDVYKIINRVKNLPMKLLMEDSEQYVKEVINNLEVLDGTDIDIDFIKNNFESIEEMGRFFLDIFNYKDDNDNKEKNHSDIIRESVLGQELVGKIFALYHENKYLYSLPEEEVEFYLDKLNMDYSDKDDLVEKQNLLYFWKQCNADMNEWSAIEFYYFLVNTFGCHNKEKKELADTSEDRSNLFVKCNYCDGGNGKYSIGFQNVCSDKMIAYNIEGRKLPWCSDDDCPCKKYYDNEITRKQLEDMFSSDEENLVCYESIMLDNWKSYGGYAKDRKPRHILKVKKNKVCILTTLLPGMSEIERCIFALFIIDEHYKGDEKRCGYVQSNSNYRIVLTPAETEIIKFWNYYENPNKPDEKKWGSGLFRYSDDNVVIRILSDLLELRKGENSYNEVRDFAKRYCDINHIEYSIPKEEFVIKEVDKEVFKETETEDIKSQTKIDSLLNNEIEKFNYEPKPEVRSEVNNTNSEKTGSVYPRNPQKRVNALIRANHKCEIDNKHISFISRRSGKPYMETHHLIPIEFWESFDYSLDVEANIICLCSNCHNEIHYGKDADKLIEELYNQRKDELEKAGLIVSLDELLKVYKIKIDAVEND